MPIGVCSAGFKHHAVPGGQRRRQLPCRHEQREVPRDDLPDHAQRLVEMIGDGVVVDFAQAAFLGAHAAGEVAKMIDRQRQIGGPGLADRLAVVDRFDRRQGFELLLHPVGDLVEHARAISRRGAAPAILGGVGGIERELDVLGGGTGDRADHRPIDRRDVLEFLALHRRHPLTADEVVIVSSDRDLLLDLGQSFLDHFRFLLMDRRAIAAAVRRRRLKPECAVIRAAGSGDGPGQVQLVCTVCRKARIFAN